MAVAVCHAASQLVEQNHQFESPYFRELTMGTIHDRYKNSQIEGKTYHKTWKQKVATSLLVPLFNHFPRVYKLLRPKGLKTVSDYANFSIESTGDVLSDLHFVERPWISHPNGVAVNELGPLLKR